MELTIAFLTYSRTEYALRTIRALLENLRGVDRVWYIADSGSSNEHVDAVHDALKAEHVFAFHHGLNMTPGQSWNEALKGCHERSDMILWLEDDWELKRPLDPTPYMALVGARPEVGLVRLGHLPVGLDLQSVGHDGRHYLRVLKSTQYCYSGNPAIRHRRFSEAYGPYNETTNPGDTEVDLDGRVRSKDGPEIWWPVDLGGWGVFGHIGAVKSYA